MDKPTAGSDSLEPSRSVDWAIASDNLLKEEPQGIAWSEFGVAKDMAAVAGKLIDVLRQKKIMGAILQVGQSKIERSHPWPPVE